jgi:hypothetical protein
MSSVSILVMSERVPTARVRLRIVHGEPLWRLGLNYKRPRLTIAV